MSILCLICKENLLSYPPGVHTGPLNQLIENVLISTSCGHLYHSICIRSWFRTQRIKRQGIPEDANTICPSCHSRVKEEDNRRIFPFENHLEALERAKMLERQENLEIHNHQLEVQLQQLMRENDMMVNRILAPSSKQNLDEFDTIVKNDRVKWMRKDEEPLNGIVLAIFKKEGKLCAKIRLDRKIRTTQRSSRLFSSFRSDKTQEVTVPFEEISLDKERAVAMAGDKSDSSPTSTSSFGKSSFSSTMFPMFYNNRNEHYRTSTLSLPDASSKNAFGYGRTSLNEFLGSMSTLGENVEKENESCSSKEASNNVPPRTTNLSRSVSYSPGFPMTTTTTTLPVGNRFLARESAAAFRGKQLPSVSESNASSNGSLDHQREYVFINAPWMKNRTKAAEPKKNVTFADDPKGSGSSPLPGGLVEKRESIQSEDFHPYANFPQTDFSISDVRGDVENAPKPRRLPPPPPIPISLEDSKEIEIVSGVSVPTTPTSPVELPTLELSLYEMMTRTDLRIPPDCNELEMNCDDEEEASNGDCFGVTLLALLYSSKNFDQLMLQDSGEDSQFCRTVKWIIREQFVVPLREFNVVQEDYGIQLKDSLSHLCSETLDIEELLTILFEFTYKLSPFINYSHDMCDYLHQFFIDFTDKERVRSVQELLQKSLLLQDNLKIEGTPEPALILQMPHSEDGHIIHYDAVVPELTMQIGELLEKDFGSSILALSAIICVKNNRYSVFLKEGVEVYSPWSYVDGIVEGRLRMRQLPGFCYWLDGLKGKEEMKVDGMPKLLKMVLQQSRVFFYTPLRCSEV